MKLCKIQYIAQKMILVIAYFYVIMIKNEYGVVRVSHVLAGGMG